MTARLCVAAAVLALAAPAAHAEICYSPAAPLTSVAPPTSTTVFTCSPGESGTLTQLAARGWRVVKLMTVQVSSGPSPQAAVQLVLQRPDRLFRHGFE